MERARLEGSRQPHWFTALPAYQQIGGWTMETSTPCYTKSDEFRYEADDQFTDGPELEAPVWIKSAQCISAVEKSAKVDEHGLCRVWYAWRDSSDLRLMLHGFLMITSLRTFDAAWDEVEFLVQMLEAEAEAEK